MTETDWFNRIDSYNMSIHAIVGFANFYLWDHSTRSDRPGVTVFQGRRLQRKTVGDGEPQPPSVTPDLGILSKPREGVLAEVKILFPQDEARWFDDFEQLMAYDADLRGWPTSDGTVDQHDIVLIVEQGRANRVRRFYEQNAGERIRFSRPFVMVVCNRSDNRQAYYFFERTIGTLTNTAVDSLLVDGTKVPMEVLLDRYSTIKLYDAEPPLPYMIELIWTQIVLDNARTDPRFRKLRKKQKLPVVLDVTEILNRLRAGFTFRSLDANAAEGSPETAHKSWVVKALEKLVNLREAEWIDATKVSIRVLFQQYEDPLRHFVVACVQGPQEPPEPQSNQQQFAFD